MSAIFDLRTRRAAQRHDQRAVIDQINAAVGILYQQTSCWPVVCMRYEKIIGAERSLVEIQRLLIELRQFVPALPKDSA